jgi:hypothetical protein
VAHLHYFNSSLICLLTFVLFHHQKADCTTLLFHHHLLFLWLLISWKEKPRDSKASMVWPYFTCLISSLPVSPLCSLCSSHHWVCSAPGIFQKTKWLVWIWKDECLSL